MNVSDIAVSDCQRVGDLLEFLAKGARTREVQGACSGVENRRPRVAVLYPGQGAQYPGMARYLYKREPSFQIAFNRCASWCGLPLSHLVFDGDKSTLERTDVTQPAIFAVQYALTEMLHSWGIRPDVVLGHSIGEYAAAYAAGMLTVEEASRIVGVRGRLMLEHCEPSALVVVGASRDDLRCLLHAQPDVDVALCNAAGSTVVGGSREAVERFRAAAASAGLLARVLPVSHAFHTRFMDPMLERFAAMTDSLGERNSEVAFVSSCTGGELKRTSGNYWVEHVRRPVRFAEALRCLGAHRPDLVVEVGPGRTLLRLAQRELGKAAAARWIALLPSGSDEHGTLMRAVLELWQSGAITH